MRKRDYVGVVIVIVAIVLLVTGMIVTTIKYDDNRKEQDNRVRASISNCIEDGGTPLFTQTRDGYINEFLGCA